MSENQNQSGGLPKVQLHVFSQTEIEGYTLYLYGDFNKPYFKAKDVADVLGHSNATSMLLSVDDDERTKFCLGREGETNFLTEYGFYEVMMQSRKPIAKKFKKAIKDLLKKLRTGEAEVKQIMDFVAAPAVREQMPQITNLAEAFEYMAKQEREKMEQQRVIENQNKKVLALENLNEEQESKLTKARQLYVEERPKVAFADAYTASEQAELISNFAKILAQNGVHTGEKRFYQYLRDNHYLCERGDFYNKPTQKSLERGLFVVESHTITSGTKSFVTTTTKITPKGQMYFINKLVKQEKNNEA